MTKPTATSASITEDHDGGRGSARFAAGPALGEVRAPGLLTDGVKLRLPEIGLDLGVLGPAGDLLLHPLRLPQGLLLRADLDGVEEVGEAGRFLRQAAAELL